MFSPSPQIENYRELLSISKILPLMSICAGGIKRAEWDNFLLSCER